MKEVQEIYRIVEEINQSHKHHLDSLEEKDELLLLIKLENGKHISVKVSREGLDIQKGEVEKPRNVVEITAKDLFRLINNRSYIVRYLTTGRIKIRGDIKRVLRILQNI